MKTKLILILLLAAWSTLLAQESIDRILLEIEKNNTTLMALQKHLAAEKIGNKTGLYPEDPEVEVNYLWGDPTVIGDRTDFGIRQTFDFPTVYALKHQIANVRNSQADLEYARQRRLLMLQARQVCADVIHANALKAELGKRLTHARSMVEAYKARYESGEANILEYNKAQMNLLRQSKALEIIEIERRNGLSVLTGLNGGIPVILVDSLFPALSITTDFSAWYKNAENCNPSLQWLEKEISIQQKQASLSRAESLPKFSAGYMSERVVGQKFQGITMGISLPLWNNKNAYQYAKASSVAMQSAAADTRLLFHNEVKALHEKVISLQASLTDYRQMLSAYSNDALLKKAFEKGELSLTEYLYELSLYYEAVDQLLEMERSYYKAVAELRQYE